MITYTIVLMVIYILVIGHECTDADNNPYVTIVSFLVMLPFFGRILGWW